MVDLATMTAFDRFVRHLLNEPRARAVVLEALTRNGSREARAERVRSAIREQRPTSPLARPELGRPAPVAMPRLTASQAYEFVAIFDQIRERNPEAVRTILDPHFPFPGGPLPPPFGPFFS